MLKSFIKSPHGKAHMPLTWRKNMFERKDAADCKELKL